MTNSTDVWVPVEYPSFQSKFPVESSSSNRSFKYRISIEDSYQNCRKQRTANYPIKLTVNHTLAKKRKLKLNQQRWEEINSAETIHICNTESQMINTIIWYSMLTITIRNIAPIPCHAIVQTILAQCTPNCNMQIMHLVYNTHVLTSVTGTIIMY